MSKFSWKRDIKFVEWRATLWYNVLRAACAGVVWGAFILVGGLATGEKGMVALAPLYPVLWPFAYLLFLLPVGLAMGFLSRLGVPFVGLMAIIFSFLVLVGDPLVWLLKKYRPSFVPVGDPRFMNLELIVFVVDEDKRTALQEGVIDSVRQTAESGGTRMRNSAVLTASDYDKDLR